MSYARLLSVAVLAATALVGCGSEVDRSEPVVLRYTVGGMSCTGCEAAIEAKVAGIDGVRACDASHEAGTALVTVSDRALETQIQEAIAGLGYTVEPADGS